MIRYNTYEEQQALNMLEMWKRAVWQMFVDFDYTFNRKQTTVFGIMPKTEQDKLKKNYRNYLSSCELKELLLIIGFEPDFIINNIKKSCSL